MNIKKRKSINRNYRRRSYRGGIFADEITDSTCAVCIEELEDNDTCTTQCGHKYHLHCILSTYDLNGGKNSNKDLFFPVMSLLRSECLFTCINS